MLGFPGEGSVLYYVVFVLVGVGAGLRTPRNVFFVPPDTCACLRPTLGHGSGVNDVRSFGEPGAVG